MTALHSIHFNAHCSTSFKFCSPICMMGGLCRLRTTTEPHTPASTAFRCTESHCQIWTEAADFELLACEWHDTNSQQIPSIHALQYSKSHDGWRDIQYVRCLTFVSLVGQKRDISPSTNG